MVSQVTWAKYVYIQWKILFKLRLASVTDIRHFRQRHSSSTVGDSLEERVHVDLLPIITAARRFLEHALDELSKLNIHVLGVLHLVVQYLRQQFVVRVSMERRDTCRQFIKNDSKRPDVNFVVVWFFTDDFRSDVEWCPFERMQAYRSRRHFPGKPEVAKFDYAITNEDVLRFQISVNDAIGVEVKERRNYLSKVVFDFLQF